MVGIEIGAYLGIETGGAEALLANLHILSMHLVHIGTRSAKVANISFEVRHLRYLLRLFNDRFLASGDDKLPLMCRDGTEGATAEASAV